MSPQQIQAFTKKKDYNIVLCICVLYVRYLQEHHSAKQSPIFVIYL